MTSEVRLPGRQAQAARNDTAVLAAARRVFIREPAAPISAVATEAGVGISALYKRYASKEELLRTLCTEGLERFSEIARSALEIEDPWDGLTAFVTGIVEADVHSLTVKLAGTFTPTPEMHQLAGDSSELSRQVFSRAHEAKVVRADLEVNDLVMIFEQVAAIRLGDDERTRALRRRYLALHLDSIREGGAVPEHPPTDAELGQRWQPK